MKKQEVLQSLICTVMFAVILVACGGGGDSVLLPGLGGGSTSRTVALLGANKTSAHVSTSNGKPLMAGFFAFQAQSANLAQSFNAICEQYNPGVVPAGAFVAIPGSGNACNAWTTIPSSADGKIIHDPGALSSLVVDVGVNSNETVSCVDKTNTASVTDRQKVRAFFRPDTNQAVIVANDAITPLACTAPIQAGATIRSIEVQWVKQ
jgi:hypothetical protein